MLQRLKAANDAQEGRREQEFGNLDIRAGLCEILFVRYYETELVIRQSANGQGRDVANEFRIAPNKIMVLAKAATPYRRFNAIERPFISGLRFLVLIRRARRAHQDSDARFDPGIGLGFYLIARDNRDALAAASG